MPLDADREAYTASHVSRGRNGCNSALRNLYPRGRKTMIVRAIVVKRRLGKGGDESARYGFPPALHFVAGRAGFMISINCGYRAYLVCARYAPIETDFASYSSRSEGGSISSSVEASCISTFMSVRSSSASIFPSHFAAMPVSLPLSVIT